MTMPFSVFVTLHAGFPKMHVHRRGWEATVVPMIDLERGAKTRQGLETRDLRKGDRERMPKSGHQSSRVLENSFLNLHLRSRSSCELLVGEVRRVWILL